MLKFFKIAGGILIAGILLFSVCLLAVYHLVQAGELRRLLISQFEEQTGAQASVGDVNLKIGNILEVTFQDFLLSERDREIPFMTADHVTVRLALRPLLERRLVFHEVRFSHPLLRVEKDAAGNFPSLNLLSRLFFPPQPHENLKLDLQKVTIEKGGILVRDPGQPPGTFVLQLQETDLRLQQVPSSATLPAAIPSGSRWRKNGLALDFALKTAIAKDNHFAQLAARGKIYPSEGDFDIRSAWVDADVRTAAIPANVISNSPTFLPSVKTLGGTLTPTFRWEGSLAEGGRLRGKIDFKQLTLEAPAFLSQAVTPGEGQAEFDLKWNPREIQISRWDLRSQEIAFSARGVSLSRAHDEVHIEGQFQTPFLPISTVQKYLPRGLSESSRWGPWLRGWSQGEVRLARAWIKGRPSDFRQIVQADLEDRLEFDLEIKEASETLEQTGRPPLKHVKGRVALEKGVLYYRDLSGAYGQSQLVEINGSQRGIFTGRHLLELRLQGDLAFQELQESLTLPFVPVRLAENARFFKDFAGKGRLKLFLKTDLASLHDFGGQLLLDQARLRIGNLFFNQIKGELAFSTSDVHTKGTTALLSGAAVAIRLTLKNYLTNDGSFDLALASSNAKAGMITNLLLSVGSLDDPGNVSGEVRYQGRLYSAKERRLTGSLQFNGAQVSLLREPLRELTGQVLLNGDSIMLQGLKGRLAGSGFDFNGQWRMEGEPQLLFSLNMVEADLNGLLSQIDHETHGWYDRLHAKGRVVIQKGRYEGFQFSNLATDLVLNNRRWLLENFSGRSAGGTIQGKAEFLDQPQGVRFSAEPNIQGVPVEGLLGWFDIGTTEISGRTNLTASLQSAGKTGSERKRSLNGAFHLEINDGTIRRFRLLVLIMSFMDLSRWFSLQMPDVYQQGIRFRSITGDFTVSQGIYSTQNLLVDSDDLRITGAGKVDGPKGELDFILAVRPFPRLDTAVNFIPLIGPGIAAIKNSFLVASFRVTGSMDSPTIVPAPLSTLSEFFFSALAIPRSLIGLPAEKTK